MVSKDEIVYNSRALVDTWLCNVKGVDRVWVEMHGNKGNDVYPCTVENCGEVIGGLLYSNNGKYSLLSLFAEVDGVKKSIGSIDII